jgi:hypothetical protein
MVNCENPQLGDPADNTETKPEVFIEWMNGF